MAARTARIAGYSLFGSPKWIQRVRIASVSRPFSLSSSLLAVLAAAATVAAPETNSKVHDGKRGGRKHAAVALTAWIRHATMGKISAQLSGCALCPCLTLLPCPACHLQPPLPAPSSPSQPSWARRR